MTQYWWAGGENGSVAERQEQWVMWEVSRNDRGLQNEWGGKGDNEDVAVEARWRRPKGNGCSQQLHSKDGEHTPNADRWMCCVVY